MELDSLKQTKPESTGAGVKHLHKIVVSLVSSILYPSTKPNHHGSKIYSEPLPNFYVLLSKFDSLTGPVAKNLQNIIEYPVSLPTKPNHQQRKIHPKPLPDCILLLDLVIKKAPSQDHPPSKANPPMDTYPQRSDIDLNPDPHTCLGTSYS